MQAFFRVNETMWHWIETKLRRDEREKMSEGAAPWPGEPLLSASSHTGPPLSFFLPGGSKGPHPTLRVFWFTSFVKQGRTDSVVGATGFESHSVPF